MSPSHQNVCGAEEIRELYALGNTQCSRCAQTRVEPIWEKEHGNKG